jgi:peptide/nickel transport system permease protein
MMSILLFGVELGWLPSGGISSPLAARWSASQRFVDQLTHLVLPALTLGMPLAAYTARVVRSQIVTALDSSISQASRARGLRERTVVRHALRHALPVLIQIAGLTLPALLGGSVVVEAVFNRPGLGNTTMSAIQGRDFPLLLGVVTSGAVAVILGNLLADLALLAVDPRLREPRSGGALSL